MATQTHRCMAIGGALAVLAATWLVVVAATQQVEAQFAQSGTGTYCHHAAYSAARQFPEPHHTWHAAAEVIERAGKGFCLYTTAEGSSSNTAQVCYTSDFISSAYGTGRQAGESLCYSLGLIPTAATPSSTISSAAAAPSSTSTTTTLLGDFETDMRCRSHEGTGDERRCTEWYDATTSPPETEMEDNSDERVCLRIDATKLVYTNLEEDCLEWSRVVLPSDSGGWRQVETGDEGFASIRYKYETLRGLHSVLCFPERHIYANSVSAVSATKLGLSSGDVYLDDYKAALLRFCEQYRGLLGTG